MFGFLKGKKKGKPTSKPVSPDQMDEEVVAENLGAPPEPDEGGSSAEADPSEDRAHAAAVALAENAAYETQRLLETYRKWALGASFAGVVLMGLLIQQFMSETDPRYFAAQRDGQLIELTPMDEPVQSSEAARSYVARAMEETFSFHYRNWRDHLFRMGDHYFTDEGLEEVAVELNDSGILSAVRDRELIMEAAVTGTPNLVESGDHSGSYAWEFEVPGTLSFEGANALSDHEVVWSVLLMRQPLSEYSEGWRIVRTTMEFR